MTTKADEKPRYRWSHPSEWLDYYLEEPTHEIDDLIYIARALAQKLDGDQIQDLFQAEMDQDGYFRDVRDCPDCGTRLTQASDEAGALPAHYCTVCDEQKAVEP